MAYSLQTTHYGLPLPTGSDKSSFLDTNEAFTAIDTALYGAVTGQSQIATDVQNLNTEILGIQSDVTEINGAIGGLQNGLASTNLLVQEHAEDITALETAMDNKQDKTDNNLVTTNKTIVGAINEVAQATPPTPTVDASDVTFDPTGSDLVSTNVEAAIKEVNGKIPEDAGSVSVNADGTKTIAQLFNELHALIDFTKVSSKSTVEIENQGQTEIESYYCDYYTSTSFHAFRAYDNVGAIHATFILIAQSSSAATGAYNAIATISTSVPPAGSTITFKY